MPTRLLVPRGGILAVLAFSVWAMPAGPVRGAVPLTAADESLLDDIERTAFRFFQEQAHPRTGLVRDRARADGSESTGKASIASSGYSFSAWVIATERGWADRAAAVERLRTKLRFLVNEAPRRHGFFYHFMEMDTGARAWKCELSSMDSALLYAGAIVAREYFADPEITALVNRLLGDVDWNWFLNDGQQVALGWHDETGFSRYRWDHYSEHVLMSFLALGVSAKPLPASYWHAWSRKPLGRYAGYVYLQEPPLFVHQFPQAYLDLRDKRDATMDYFRNSQLATLAQRQMSIDLKPEFPLWGENLWGLAASDSATGYKAWGGPPRTLRFNALDGTVVPCAPAGSLPFEPEKTLVVLRNLMSTYGDRIWKRYGFVDAFNPHNGWVNADVIGIDQGVTMLQAENLRTGLIHRLFMQAPEVKLGMQKAGFVSTSREVGREGEAQLRRLASSAWQSLQTQPAERGLQITAALAAHRLGLIGAAEAAATIKEWVDAPAPASLQATGLFAAGLIAVRQALPALEAGATAALARLQWDAPAANEKLGSAARLAAFLAIGAGARPVADWTSLDRSTQAIGGVHVLAPADAAGAVVPGLWLEERAILSGASRSQLAYSRLSRAADASPAALDFALLLGEFPVETFARRASSSTLLTSLPGEPDAQAALLISIANLLEHDCVREWFGRDAVVKAARIAIAEFQEAAFSPGRTSVLAQRELAGPLILPAQRAAIAVSAALPPEQWQWHRVAGMEFKDSLADVRPEDAPVEMSFAFAWDASALHFRAKVIDEPRGYSLARERNRVVEIYVDPPRDGLVWLGAGDYQFAFLRAHHWELRNAAEATEFFHGAASAGKVTPTEDGYLVEGSIPWSTLGLHPVAGLRIGVSPALIAEGTKEWEAALKLNWSYVRLDETRARLGVLTLQ
ncbi:MAG: hypothetical protein C0502_05245 [Opitutus sp.]|nr:hypothetical protein [Opitutus sp.]